MSASREKKQRQGAGSSEKALQAQQQQAAQKRKTITYTVIGVVIGVLVAALLIWNTGFFQARATAATVGGESLTAAELSYYYYDARMYTAQLAAYGLNNYNTSLADDEQYYDESAGQTYRDYFMEEALDSARRSIALSSEAKKNGHTEAEVKDSLNAQIQSVKTSASQYGYSYASYLKAMYGTYMSAGVYEKLYTMDLLANLIYSEKGSELTDSYSQDELRAYYEKDDNADSLDTFEYSYLYFTPAAVEEKDEDGNELDEDAVAELKKAALAEAKANAEEALEAVKGGSSISSQAEKYELAETRYGDHETIVGITSAAAAIQDDLLAMKADDVELVANGESGYYVVTLHSRRLVEDPTRDVRHILARAETTTDEEGNAVPPTDEAWAAAKERIEAIQAEYEAGARTEDSFAALANEKSDDGDGTTGGLYTKISPSSNYVPEFLEWIFEDGRKAGDTGIVQHDAGDSTRGYWGYHFMYMVGDNEPVWMGSVRSTLASEDRNAWVEELKGNYETSLTDAAGNIGR